jgi:hypothetical protein
VIQHSEETGESTESPSAPQKATFAKSAFWVACAGLVFVWLLHPRIGVRDWDGWSYLSGALSLRAGKGYRGHSGVPLNRWPPGYSLVLSPFGDPVLAAQILNYIAFGATVGLLYYLLRRNGWSWQAALGFTVTLGAGFFRLLATMVHADILTYALFLAGICLAVGSDSRTRSALIWAGLFFFKFIAGVFLPPALVADYASGKKDWKLLSRMYAPGVIVTAAAVGAIFVFDFVTERSLIPAGHPEPSQQSIFSSIRGFAVYSLRSFLFDCYGSVHAPFPRVAFPVCMILWAACFLSLRAASQGRWLRVYGAACLICSALLLFVRWYEFTPRLAGYGLVILIAGYQPVKRADWLWILLGVVSLANGVVNGLTVNSLGANDPRYARLVAEYEAYAPRLESVATNASGLLFADRDMGWTGDADSAHEQKILWVDLPVYDAMMEMVIQMPRPGPGWCAEKQFSGGTLFRRCDATPAPQAH